MFLSTAICFFDISVCGFLFFWYFYLQLFVIILIFLSTAIRDSDICCNRRSNLLANRWWLRVRNSKQVNQYTIMHPPPTHTQPHTPLPFLHTHFILFWISFISFKYMTVCYLFYGRVKRYLYNVFPSIHCFNFFYIFQLYKKSHKIMLIYLAYYYFQSGCFLLHRHEPSVWEFVSCGALH